MTDSDDFEKNHDARVRAGAAHSGLWLRQRREELGLDLPGMARQLHMSLAALKALEESDAPLLPPPVYVRGFLRNYARLLNLPEADVVAGYPVEQPAPVKVSEPAAAAEDPEDARSGLLWPALGGLVLLGGLGLLSLNHFGRTAPPLAEPTAISLPPPVAETVATEPTSLIPAAPVPSSPAPVVAIAETPPPPLPVATPPGADTLVLHFSGASWVSVVDADGRRLLSEAAKPGSTRSVSGKAPLKLNIGRPGNVTLEYNGQPVMPMTTGNGAPVSLKVGDG